VRGLRLVWTYPARARIDAYRALIRIDLNGLDTCPGDCSASPFGRCEHHEVEHRLGYPVNPDHPSDLAIAYALRLEAEFRDDDGVDYDQRIREAPEVGPISAKAKQRLLELEARTRDRAIESAAFAIMTAEHGHSPIGSGPNRRWRGDLSPTEQDERRRLEEARHNSGFTAEDRKRYHELTKRQPIEPVDWSVLPFGLSDQAEAAVDRQRDIARGKGRDRRIPGTRHRLPSQLLPSLPFGHQLGPIKTSDDPAVLEDAVRDLRRNAKRLELHDQDYDRRRKVEPS
jgi:hypothetical protein